MTTVRIELQRPRVGSISRLSAIVRRNGTLAVGAAVLALFVLAALFAPFLAGFDPIEANPSAVLLPPDAVHWFGTDPSGMDIYSRVLYGARLDLLIAGLGTAIAFAIGVPLGVMAGFYRGKSSEVLMRGADLVQSFPLLIVAMAFVTLTGQGAIDVLLAIALLNTPIFMRLVRASTLAIRDRTFVESAICTGNSEFRLLYRHVLPNVVGGAIAQIPVTAAWAILLTAGLSFLGIGVEVPTPEWGSMVNVGAKTMITGQWWVAVFPGLAITFAVLAFHLVGDGLEKKLGVAR